MLSVNRVISADATQEREIRFRLRNTTTSPLRYEGYGQEFPILLAAHRSSIGWVRTKGPWCGTGIQTYELAPGEQIEFSFRIYRDVVHHLVRVSLWTANGFQIWSPTINLDQTVKPSGS